MQECATRSQETAKVEFPGCINLPACLFVTDLRILRKVFALRELSLTPSV